MPWKWVLFFGLTVFAYFTHASQSASSCQVDIGFGQRSIGNRCQNGQVMTGADDNYIYCSTIRVTCPHQTASQRIGMPNND